MEARWPGTFDPAGYLRRPCTGIEIASESRRHLRGVARAGPEKGKESSAYELASQEQRSRRDWIIRAPERDARNTPPQRSVAGSKDHHSDRASRQRQDRTSPV